MDTEVLNIFVDCVRTLSFSRVARERNVDPAKITRSIRALEDQLSLKLFHRTTRRIEPTEAGMVYFERVEPLVEELRKAQLAAADTQAKPKGILRISSPVSFAQMKITPLLPTFSERYPEIAIDYMLNDEDVDVITHHIDVAIRVGPIQDSRLIAVKLADMTMQLVASPEYLAKHGRPVAPQELVNHRCLQLRYRGFDKHKWMFTCSEWEKTKSVTINPHLTTSNALALKQCAIKGMGISLLASWMVEKELENGSLINVFPEIQASSAISDAAAWAVYPSRDYLPNKTRVFIEYLKAHFRGHY